MSKNEMIMLPREVVEQALEALLNEGEFRKLLKPLIEKSIDSIRAALEQPDAGPTATAPEGWKLVPVVPTNTMLDNAWSKAACYQSTARDAWEAMLNYAPTLEEYAHYYAAAPQPPEHYDQQALDLCLTCGWKTMIPGDCCLNCARQKPQGEQEPVAWCALNADRSGIAYFDGRPIIMTGPIGNEHHPDPLYTKPQPKPTPYLYYDPENGDTWTQEAIDDGCCPPDGLIALYTK